MLLSNDVFEADEKSYHAMMMNATSTNANKSTKTKALHVNLFLFALFVLPNLADNSFFDRCTSAAASDPDSMESSDQSDDSASSLLPASMSAIEYLPWREPLLLFPFLECFLEGIFVFVVWCSTSSVDVCCLQNSKRSHADTCCGGVVSNTDQSSK